MDKIKEGAASREDSASRLDSDWNAYAVYTLGFLTLISAFNYLDRTILGLALPSIKAEMHVSDTVLGLVSGLAFVMLYTLLGVPIAWAADRYSRKIILSIGFAFWSAMTFVTGFVANIWQLALARFLMGAGEACGLAPSNSMISDLFRAARRPLALSIFGMANSIAFIAFFPLVGWIGDLFGWRSMFMAAGIPGFVLAIIFFLTVREPERGAMEERASNRKFDPESFWVTARYLVRSRVYLLILLGSMFMGANVYAASAWTPTFLVRVHDMSLAEIASFIGPVRGVLGAAGILIGGVLTDRLGRADARWRVRLPGWACLLVGPAEVLFLLGDHTVVWLTGFALTSFLTLVHIGPIFAVTVTVAKVRMRAFATSIVVLCANLLGQAGGPLLAGFLNDTLLPVFGEHAIRYSLLITAVTAVAAGLSFWAAVRYIQEDIQRASDEAV
jgi:MFS family permease